MAEAYIPVPMKQPTEPGWYCYSGGAQSMIFLLTEQGQWYTHFSNGDGGPCDWGYIEQAFGVWDLIRIPLPKT